MRLFCYIRRSYSVGIVFSSLWASTAWAQSECEDVPADRRAQCERVMDCMTVEDGDVRRACIAVSQRSAIDTPTKEAAEDAPILVDLVVIPRRKSTQSRQQDARRPVKVEPEVPDVPEEENSDTEDTTAEPLPEIPVGTFSGKVTRIFESYLKRQIIAIENRYLFESNEADEARFRVGHLIEGRQAKSFFGSGRKWRLTGPSTRSIYAFRIRCEREDIGRDDRKRCNGMLNL